MPLLAEPDLIVNTDGSVYHICMKPEDLADTVIVVGDPQRVHEISEHFTGIDHRASNREFISATGYYHGKRITALSTGIGTDNIDIVMHELDALANFDLKTRIQNPVLRSLNVIRIGTSGSIQADVPVNSFSLSTYAVGLDNLLHFYKGTPGIIAKEMTEAFAAHALWPKDLSKPYFVKGSEKLVNLFRPFTVPGITVTASGFYGPQGRFLRLPLTDPDMIKKLQSFNFQGHRIVNFEMETSALYGLGALMGHEMVTICTLIANRATGDYNPDHKKVVNSLIALVLEHITL
ncbi:MAG: nucleoside phosphorylase [Bacteroidetes bacterium]|nr:nucleoside phosphorylase [Bacteroidota bacterium]